MCRGNMIRNYHKPSLPLLAEKRIVDWHREQRRLEIERLWDLYCKIFPEDMMAELLKQHRQESFLLTSTKPMSWFNCELLYGQKFVFPVNPGITMPNNVFFEEDLLNG